MFWIIKMFFLKISRFFLIFLGSFLIFRFTFFLGWADSYQSAALARVAPGSHRCPRWALGTRSSPSQGRQDAISVGLTQTQFGQAQYSWITFSKYISNPFLHLTLIAYSSIDATLALALTKASSGIKLRSTIPV